MVECGMISKDLDSMLITWKRAKEQTNCDRQNVIMEKEKTKHSVVVGGCWGIETNK
jgi:hypothetical protein